MLLVSMFGSCLGFIVQGLSTSFHMLVLGRALAGMFGASIPIAQSTVADLVPHQDRPKYFAIQGVVLSVAFMFGPGIGAGLAEFSLRTPLFVAAGLAGFGFLLVSYHFKEPERCSFADETEPSAKESDEGMEELKSRRNRCIACILVASFTSMLSFAAWLYFSGLYVFKRFGWGPLSYGFLSMALASVSVFVQTFPYARIVKRLGKHGATLLGVAFQGVGMLGVAAVGGEVSKITGLPLLAVASGFITIGYAILNPSLTAVLSRHASSSDQGSILGLSQGLQAFARVAGPLLYGSIFDIDASMSYIIAAAIAACSAVFVNLSMRINAVSTRPAQLHVSTTPRTTVSSEELIASLQQEVAELRKQLAARNITNDYTAPSSTVISNVALRQYRAPSNDDYIEFPPVYVSPSYHLSPHRYVAP